jgi:(2R)-3-sulfolactate dehydrogenase (NADP+)
MAPVGGNKPVIGTNPLSFAVPGKAGKIAFLIDQSSSQVPWTAVKLASEARRKIPLGWALDADGQPTDDPDKGLAGSMAPAGGHKGFGQGLIVEVMCAAVTGSNLGPQMGSFMDNGKPIGCGQFFIAFAPKKFAGSGFDRQIATLVSSITSQPGARLPNSRRTANIVRAKRHGLQIEEGLLARLKGFAA